jgi:hypothetical protein
MKIEAWVFGVNAVFFTIVTPSYWYISHEVTGTSALVLTTCLAWLVTFYLGFHATKMDARPEDRNEAEIVDGAGEVGFFPPYSVWPLYCALALVVCVLGVVFGWWILIIGVGVGAIALSGFVFEYYKGEHIH